MIAEFLQERPAVPVVCRMDTSLEGLKTIQLSPWGEVKSKRGVFLMDDVAASAIIAAFNEHQTDVPIDFEHQTLGGEFASPTGLAPAAGWIKQVFADRGRGLFALVFWNQQAVALIRSGQYKYISPVLLVRQEDRRAVALHSASLVNLPAIGGMDAVVAMTPTPELENEMPSEANPAETERMLGEIRALLREKGTELGPEAGRNDILQAVIEALSGKKPEKKEDETDKDKPTEESEQVASSLRRQLGLGSDASTSETLLTLSLRLGQGSGDGVARTELAVMQAADADRCARELVDRYVASNRINKNDRHQYAVALSLARQDPQKFERVMGSTIPYVQPGRTVPPSGGLNATGRDKVILSASREFNDNPELAKLVNVSEHVNAALRGDAMAKLSDDEIKRL